MRRFAGGGIVMNCQIVCCPGLNDGKALMQTMQDLAAMYPAVHSVSIVPVGLTKYREGLYPLESFTPEHSGETIDMVTAFGDECVKKIRHEDILLLGRNVYLRAARAAGRRFLRGAHAA